MSEFKLNADLEMAIGKSEGALNLIDDQGNIKGVVISPYMHSVLRQIIGPEPSQEEIDAVTEDTPGYTTQEAMVILNARFPGFDGGR